MKNLFISFILFFSFLVSMAQLPMDENINQGKNGNYHQKRERIESMKIGFITDKLSLSTEEAQKFWPVYNEYQAKQDKIRKGWRQFETGQIKPEDLSEEQLNELMKAKLDSKIEEAKLDKEYHQKFIDVLGIKKVADFYKAEADFKRELLHQINKGPNN